MSFKGIPGAIRIACPKCRKLTRSYLGSGWAITWCNKCRQWFRTANELLSQDLLDQYQMPDLPKDVPPES